MIEQTCPAHPATSRCLSGKVNAFHFQTSFAWPRNHFTFVEWHGKFSGIAKCARCGGRSRSGAGPTQNEPRAVWSGNAGPARDTIQSGITRGLTFSSWQTLLDLRLFIFLGRAGRSRAGECARSYRALSFERPPRGVRHAGPQPLEQTIFRNKARHQRRSAGA
jgi:hypothetical protein